MKFIGGCDVNMHHAMYCALYAERLFARINLNFHRAFRIFYARASRVGRSAGVTRP